MVQYFLFLRIGSEPGASVRKSTWIRPQFWFSALGSMLR